MIKDSPLWQELKSILDTRLMYLDGAMGTTIQNYKLIRSSYYINGTPQYTKLPELNIKLNQINLQ